MDGEDDPSAGLRAARAYGDAGNPRAAAQALRRVLAAHPDHALALSLLGYYSDALGDPAGALAACRAALALRPGDGDVHCLLAVVLSRRRAGWTSALVHFREAVRLAPEDPHNRYQLALQHVRMSRPRYALEALRQACERGPDDPAILGGAAHLLFALRRVREARVLAARAFAAGPDSAVALAAEARSRLVGGRPGEALDLARAAVALDATYLPAIEALVEAELCRWRPVALWSRLRGWIMAGRLRGAALAYAAASGFSALLVQAGKASPLAGPLAVVALGALAALWVVLPHAVMRRRIAAARRPARLSPRF